MNDGILPVSTQYIGSIKGDSNSLNNPIPSICKLDNKLDWRKVGSNGWDAILNSTIETIRNSNTFSFTRFTQKATFPGGTNPYLGGILMPNGNIILIPFNSTTALIYDPYNDTTSVPSGTYSGTSSFSAGVLLPNGEILFIPRRVACTVYNPVTNSIRTIGSAPATADAYAAGVLLQDGRVFCAPNNVTTALIIDPVKNTTFVPSGTYSDANIGQSAGYSICSLLLHDGRVLVTSSYGTSAFHGIYNPFTNTLKRTTTFGIFVYGAILLPNNIVLLISGSNASGASQRLIFYDYQRDTIKSSNTLLPPFNGSWGAGQGVVLLPDGRIFCQPNITASSFIYNYNTDTATLATGTTTANNYTGGTILPDGRLILYPRNATACIGYGIKGPSFSMDVLLSAHHNFRK